MTKSLYKDFRNSAYSLLCEAPTTLLWSSRIHTIMTTSLYNGYERLNALNCLMMCMSVMMRLYGFFSELPKTAFRCMGFWRSSEKVSCQPPRFDGPQAPVAVSAGSWCWSSYTRTRTASYSNKNVPTDQLYICSRTSVHIGILDYSGLVSYYLFQINRQTELLNINMIIIKRLYA